MSSFLSKVYGFLGPSENQALSSSFSLLLGPKAQGSLPAYVDSKYPKRNYQFTPLSSPLEKDLAMEVTSDRFLIMSYKEGRPYASGDEPGFVVLMRSSTHLGVVKIQRTVEPLRNALKEMKSLTDKKFELFIVDGKASDCKLYEEACRFIQCFNKAHQGVITISDDLFRFFDFPGPVPSQRVGVQFAGFDQNNKPIALIDYC